MTLDELIAKLQAIREKEGGNLPVFVSVDTYLEQLDGKATSVDVGRLGHDGELMVFIEHITPL